MAEIRHACEDGLTPACFEKHPQYAKKVFAYRLMHTLCPARMTRKLRDSLWKGLTEFPLSWVPPEDFILPPEKTWEEVFPEDWTPADPLPEGVTIDPSFRIQIPQLKLMYIFIEPGKTWKEVFPNGWDPTGPLPDGASWTPYYTLPAVYSPGWAPGGPLPEGVIIEPGIEFRAGEQSIEPITPEQIQAAIYRRTGSRPPRRALTAAQMHRGIAAEEGTAPPLYMGPWEPGPVHRPTNTPSVSVETWFSDTFENLNEWTIHTYIDGTVAIADEKLKLYYVWDIGIGNAGIKRTDTRAWPENWTWSFDFNYDAGTTNFTTYCYTGTTRIRMRFVPPTTIRFIDENGYKDITVQNFVGTTDTWKVIVTGMTASLYRNDVLIEADMTLQSYTNKPGRMDHYNEGLAITYTDNYLITIP